MPAHRTGQMVSCAKCGTETYRKAGEIARSKGRLFCSLACRNAAGPRTALAARFWAGVDRSNPDGCWPWTRAIRNSAGHGGVWDGKRWTHAHRVAYTLTYGPIAPGLEVCHRCDNPPCCRPDHLFLGTHEENMADMKAKLRAAKRFTLEFEQQVMLLAAQGWGSWRISRALGISKSSVRRVRDRNERGLT